jgi:ribosome-associated protein
MTIDTLQTLELIAQTIFDKKGSNILALDIREVSSLTDFVIIGEGNVDRHVQSLSTSIVHALRDQGISPLHVEGIQLGDWIVLDYGEFMVHLFTPDLRQKYGLEELWRQSKIVNVNIKLDPAHGKT